MRIFGMGVLGGFWKPVLARLSNGSYLKLKMKDVGWL